MGGAILSIRGKQDTTRVVSYLKMFTDNANKTIIQITMYKQQLGRGAGGESGAVGVASLLCQYNLQDMAYVPDLHANILHLLGSLQSMDPGCSLKTKWTSQQRTLHHTMHILFDRSSCPRDFRSMTCRSVHSQNTCTPNTYTNTQHTAKALSYTRLISSEDLCPGTQLVGEVWAIFLH